MIKFCLLSISLSVPFKIYHHNFIVQYIFSLILHYISTLSISEYLPFYLRQDCNLIYCTVLIPVSLQIQKEEFPSRSDNRLSVAKETELQIKQKSNLVPSSDSMNLVKLSCSCLIW